MLLPEKPNTWNITQIHWFCLPPKLSFHQKQDARLGKLHDLPAGTRVGLALDASRKLHVYLNGTDLGVFGTDIPQPAYFVFDLYSYCTKVSLSLSRPKGMACTAVYTSVHALPMDAPTQRLGETA